MKLSRFAFLAVVICFALCISVGTKSSLADTTSKIVSSKKTWVKTDTRSKRDYRDAEPDKVSLPDVITLADLGVAPGDILQVYSSGDFQPCSYAPNPACVDQAIGMLGTFVGRRTKPVPFGVGSTVMEVTTDKTCRYFYNNGRRPISTDVSHDFVVSVRPDAQSLLVVPIDAVGLIFGTYDCYFYDNSDPDGDFQIHIGLLPRTIEVTETKYSIEDRNKYSENVVLSARVVFPVGHPNAGETDTSFDDYLGFEENGTDYYNGNSGSTKLPFKKARRGVLGATIKSTSTVPVRTTAKPMPAKITVNAPSFPNSITEGSIEVEQWRDADSNQIIDWLDHSVRDILKCARQKGGELKEVTNAVMRVRQASPAEVVEKCGTTMDSKGPTHVVAISPFCPNDAISSNDPHRLNEGKSLSDTVLHEIRHAWQYGQRNRADSNIVDDDMDPNTPQNDDDKDYYLERISRSSAILLLESNRGQTDRREDNPHAFPGKWGGDAELFALNNRKKCP